MMLMTMRPQKDQFTDPLVYKYTAAGSFDKRNKALMFGFTQYDAILVGAAGGYGGQATSSSYIATYTAFRAGGGGGGMLRLQDSLAKLALSEPITVGAVGAAGANSTNDGQAGNGGNGGTTTFKGQSAYGGGGGKGAKWKTGPAYHKDKSIYPTNDGGAGGGNTAGLGAGGVGGTGGYYYHAVDTGTTSTSVSTSPTAGTYVAGGTAPVIGGGKGGGGGPGDNTGVAGDAPRAGADGANGSAYDTPGGGVITSHGGAGGGADLFELTGVHEYYGSNISGKNPGGAVVIKIS